MEGFQIAHTTDNEHDSNINKGKQNKRRRREVARGDSPENELHIRSASLLDHIMCTRQELI